MHQQAYSSTVFAPIQLILAFIFAGGFIVSGVLTGVPSPWLTSAVALTLLLTGIHLGTVRLSVSSDRIVIGQPLSRGRVISARDVRDVRVSTISWAQVFGFGVTLRRRTTRLTIRPGPTLSLVLADGERVRISTADPQAARSTLETRKS
jgi:hypothetical protein